MASADDPFDLERFVAAQAPVMAAVEAELAAGRKRSHWMWFVFPQIDGLGLSAMSERYAISGLGEARAYLDHPLLGARLRRLTQLVHGHAGKTAHEIFGSPDDLKFRSSMTLFDATEPGREFRTALDRFFDGEGDDGTLQLLGR